MFENFLVKGSNRKRQFKVGDSLLYLIHFKGSGNLQQSSIFPQSLHLLFEGSALGFGPHLPDEQGRQSCHQAVEPVGERSAELHHRRISRRDQEVGRPLSRQCDSNNMPCRRFDQTRLYRRAAYIISKYIHCLCLYILISLTPCNHLINNTLQFDP